MAINGVTAIPYLVTTLILLSWTEAVHENQRSDTDVRVSLEPIYGRPRFLYVREHQTVTLACTTINMDTRRFLWRHNDVPVTNGSYDVTTVPGQLHIESVTAESEGTYNCLVHTGAGTLVSETVNMKLANITTSAERGEEYINTNEIPCDVTELVPRGVVAWTRDNKPLNPQENIHMDLHGTLIFLYKKGVDVNVVYQCHVTNSMMNISVSGKRRFLNGRTDRQQTGPHLVRTSPTMTGTERDDVTLECVFEGDPSPSITWKKNHRQLFVASDRYKFPSVQGRQLLITNLTRSDAGTYMCIASNTLDERVSKVQLNVRGRPLALHPPVSRTVLTGSHVTYNCTARQHARVDWIINGVPYKAGNETDFLDALGTSLTVSSPAQQGVGVCVQCNISDELVYSLYSACIQYVEKLPTTTSTAIPATQRKTSSDTESAPSWLKTVVASIVCGVFVVVIVTVIIAMIIRKRRSGVKKRLSTVGTELPNRASLFWETQMFVKKKIGRSRQVQGEDEEEEECPEQTNN